LEQSLRPEVPWMLRGLAQVQYLSPTRTPTPHPHAHRCEHTAVTPAEHREYRLYWGNIKIPDDELEEEPEEDTDPEEEPSPLPNAELEEDRPPRSFNRQREDDDNDEDDENEDDENEDDENEDDLSPQEVQRFFQLEQPSDLSPQEVEQWVLEGRPPRSFKRQREDDVNDEDDENEDDENDDENDEKPPSDLSPQEVQRFVQLEQPSDLSPREVVQWVLERALGFSPEEDIDPEDEDDDDENDRKLLSDLSPQEVEQWVLGRNLPQAASDQLKGVDGYTLAHASPAELRGLLNLNLLQWSTFWRHLASAKESGVCLQK